MDPPHSVAPLSAPPTPNLMGVMQSKCAPSQAFLVCCPLQSLPELYLCLLSRSSSGYILCSSLIQLHSRYYIKILQSPETQEIKYKKGNYNYF